MPAGSPKITGRQVAGARGLLGLSQEALAVACDLTSYTISTFETGTHQPRTKTIEIIRVELERRGVEFINGRGVILKKTTADETPAEP